MSEYTHFTLEQWEELEKEAYRKYVKSIGKPPSRDEIKRTMINENPINIVYKLGFVLLSAILIFQSIKIVYASAPLANLLAEALSHSGQTNPVMLEIFKISTAVVSVLTGTIGLIFMEIFAMNSITQARMRQTKNSPKWSLEYISPRLPFALVYLIMAYLLIISNVGQQSIVERLMTNITVFSELALAIPFGQVLSRMEKNREAVTQELHTRRLYYDELINNYEASTDYLRGLLQISRGAFFRLSPKNAKYRGANLEVIEQILAKEMQRLKGGAIFAGIVSNWQDAKHEVRSTSTGKITPPTGGAWSHETLYNSLVAHNAPHDITEKWITSKYEAGYNARKVWRASVKKDWQSK